LTRAARATNLVAFIGKWEGRLPSLTIKDIPSPLM
jgi:hypothetical protein